MYRAPENINRVKTIKSKFENIQNNVNNPPEKKVLQNGNRCHLNLNNTSTKIVQNNNCNLNSASNKNKTEIDIKNIKKESSLSLQTRHNLTRQLSDPSKCNIKRTPAFRVDKTSEQAINFQRDVLENRSHRFENKIKQYNSVVKNNNDRKITRNSSQKSSDSELVKTIDSLTSSVKTFDSMTSIKTIDSSTDKTSAIQDHKTSNSALKMTNNNKCSETNKRKSVSPLKKPLFLKSKSSIDFAHLKSKFDSPTGQSNLDTTQNNFNIAPNESQRNYESINNTNNSDKINLALLYTEPIPKALRPKNRDTEESPPTENNFFNNSDIYVNVEDVNINNSNEKLHNCSTLKLSEAVKPGCDISSELVKLNTSVGLTDTLQRALSKPLPAGPAPQKPPRTFVHTPQNSPTDNLERNRSFLHSPKDFGKKLDSRPRLPNGKTNSKSDPKYMLNKLENALRNNKLRSKKTLKVDMSTSGEDSDDSVLFKSKSRRDLPEIPITNNVANLSKSDSLENLGIFSDCFHGLACSRSPYAKINEPNSSFFVSSEKEEHVYDEPLMGFSRKQALDSEMDIMRKNHLYYLSSPVQCGSEKVVPECPDNKPIHGTNMEINEEKESKIAKDTVVNGKPPLSEDSSLSSFTSDFDSATSTPQEETKPIDQSNKIKHLIRNFETKPEPPVVKTVTNIDSSTRIEELKNTLKSTLDRCFTSQDMNFKDSNSESEKSEIFSRDQKSNTVDEMVNKFQTYVKMIRSYSKTKIKKDNHLFDCCFIVGWVNKTAQIKFKFPYNAKIPHRIEDLCYPEASTGPLDRSNNAQCYSLVITNDKGERTFGYCRRVIPEGSKDCLPLAYCILSKIRAPRFYKRILIELESRHGLPDRQRDELISEFYYNTFPRPGESIKINLTNIMCSLDSIAGTRKHYDTTYSSISSEGNMYDSLDLSTYVIVNKTGEYGTLNKVVKKHAKDYERIYINVNDYKTACNTPRLIAEKNGSTELIITLHSDTRYEDADLKPLHNLPREILLKIFASLLLERKVILVSCVINKLSCCVDSLQSILYPFSWPHTFIPILPQSLWDIVESPTPVLCGVLSVAVVNDFKIEHGIVVDLDEGNILIEEGDEDQILCSSMTKAWYRGLSLADSVSPETYVHSVYLSDAYLMVFIACFRDYKNYIHNGKFEKETFLRSKSKGKRRFLKWFTETTMFMIFLESVLSDPKSFSLFDKKIEMYGSEESDIIVDKLLEWKR